MTAENIDRLAYRDTQSPGNKLRPRVRCLGCRKLGCTTAWGPWCFNCNVRRMDRISGALEGEIASRTGYAALNGTNKEARPGGTGPREPRRLVPLGAGYKTHPDSGRLFPATDDDGEPG